MADAGVRVWPAPRVAGRIYYGWIVLGLASLAMIGTLPARTQGLGLITEPLMRDVGIGRVAYAQINLIATLVGALGCFGVGRLIDRRGSRIVLTTVAFALGVVVIAMSRATGALAILILVTLTRGFGQSALSIVSLAMVGKWFRRRLTRAMAVYALVMSIGFMVAFPLVGQMVLASGWRIAWAVVGASLVFVLAPLAWLIDRSSPEAIGLEADGDGIADDHRDGDTASASLGAALRTPSFWVVALASSAYGLVASGIGLFNESILTERGFAPDVYYTALAVTAITGLAGNFAAGAFADRGSLRHVLLAALVILSGGLVALAHVTTWAQVMAQAVAMGIGGGFVMVVFFSFWGRAYGPAHLGRIQGAAQAMTVFASAIGPLLLALCVNFTGSYAAAFYALAAVVAALGICAAIVPMPVGAERQAATWGAGFSRLKFGSSRLKSAFSWLKSAQRRIPQTLGSSNRAMPIRTAQLVRRSLTYYWRTNIAVVLGVATAVAVLAGALLVGDSVRGSLRDLVTSRLGRTDVTLVSSGFFREQLSDDLVASEPFTSSFAGAAPLIALQGVVTVQESGRRVGNVHVYGVDDRFWRFHGVTPVADVGERDVLVNETLSREIGARPGEALLVRVPLPSAMPLESLVGKKDDLGRTLRLTVRGVVPSSALGEFSLDAQQGDILAVFVPLARIQQEIEVPGRVNTLLAAASEGHKSDAARQLEALVRSKAELEDVGLKVRTTEAARKIIVESDAGVLDDRQVPAITTTLEQSGMPTQAIFTYLANAIRHGDREVPYSLVTALDLSTLVPSVTTRPAGAVPDIVLNSWAASELRATIGDSVRMDYFVWEDPGRLVTRSTDFQVAAIVPIEAGDRDLAPVYPGISDSASLSDWDPPFPVDLRRVRPIDEEYWDRYRTTPKAFISLAVGQRLWRTRYGAITSIRAAGGSESLAVARSQALPRLRAALDPLAMGLIVRDVRAEGLAASRGATDFGEYFVYFSFFLVVSALLLAALFFKLGIEQRAREVGLLRAVGFGPGAVRRLFLIEGSLLAVIGSALGTLGAVGYASLLMIGLRSWWVDAVGTTALTLHVSATSLVGGAIGGIVAAVACIWWTLRSLSHISERSLLAGEVVRTFRSAVSGRSAFAGRPKGLHYFSAAIALVLVAGGLMTAAVARRIDPAGAFFGAGSALLVASLCLFAFVLRRPVRHAMGGSGWRPVSRLGMRSATYRPGRSVLSMGVIACATFILIAVSAFRRDGGVATNDPHSGTGGYELMVESLLPVVHDPNTAEGREALNLFDLDPSVTIEPFRLLPGDDTSCLNLYEPRNPRILAPRDSFIAAGRFAFQDSLAGNPEDAANPWRLLHRMEPDGAIPVIADANSMTYVLHRRLGETMVITRGGQPITLRFVATLSDSIFQRELLMSQANFLRLFPDEEGFPFLLVDTGTAPVATVGSKIEDGLRDFGADATNTAELLASFHRVENTYLSTFQTLGGLGLLLGTVGMAAVLMRNMLERRRELALLGAVGYGRGDFLLMAVAENTVLVVCGLAAGAVSAGLAIAPAVAERGGRIPFTSGAMLLLFGVLIVALLSSIAAVAAATRAPLLESLRAE